MTTQNGPDTVQSTHQEDSLVGFSLDALRLTQDFAGELGVRKLITTIPVRKPDRQAFFRIRPEQAYKLAVAVIDLKAEGETYLVIPSLAAQLVGEIKAQLLTVAITRQGVLFVWPLPLPGPDGRINPWHSSAMQAAQLAENSWIRMSANLGLGAYDIYRAEAPLAEPEWPDLTMEQIVEIAFKDRIITDPDHPVLRRLRGEV